VVLAGDPFEAFDDLVRHKSEPESEPEAGDKPGTDDTVAADEAERD
jgi:hypothetical protein